MTIQIYEHPESVCCQKVGVALIEKGVECEKVHIEFARGEQFSPKFLCLNSKAVVPVLVHDGRVLTESTVINEYLDEAFDGPSLMPGDAYGRARKRYWSRQVDHLHMPHIAAISFSIAFRHALLGAIDTPEKQDAHLARVRDPISQAMQREALEMGLESPMFHQAVVEFDRLLGDMEHTLSETPWLAGDAFSLADIDVSPYIWRLHTLQLDGMWADRPGVQDWSARMWSRSSWKQGVIERHVDNWLDAMQTHGAEAWPRVEAIIAAARPHIS